MVKQETPKAAQGSDVWTGDPDVQTGERVEQPREGVDDGTVVGGFTGTGVTGSQGGRATYGAAPEDEPLDGEAKE